MVYPFCFEDSSLSLILLLHWGGLEVTYPTSISNIFVHRGPLIVYDRFATWEKKYEQSSTRAESINNNVLLYTFRFLKFHLLDLVFYLYERKCCNWRLESNLWSGVNQWFFSVSQHSVLFLIRNWPLFANLRCCFQIASNWLIWELLLHFSSLSFWVDFLLSTMRDQPLRSSGCISSFLPLDRQDLPPRFCLLGTDLHLFNASTKTL